MNSLGDSSLEFKDFIIKMLHPKQNMRMTVKEVLEHPWYKGKTSTHKESVVELNKALLQQYKV